jgi:hypothetical protein
LERVRVSGGGPALPPERALPPEQAPPLQLLMRKRMRPTMKYHTGIELYQNQKMRRKPNLPLLALAQGSMALDQWSRRE